MGKISTNTLLSTTTDADYYRDHYQNGVYSSPSAEPSSRVNSSIGRRTTLMRKKSERIVRCSEAYNTTQ